VIAGQTRIDLADIQLFRSTFNLPANDPQLILVPGLKDPGISDDDVPEAHLDIEWAGAVARNAAILYVYSTT
jgi:subtilase family serine protease